MIEPGGEERVNHVTEPEEASPEMLVRELAEWIAIPSISADPDRAADVERAKNYVALGFPADFQSVGQIAGQIEELVIYGLPDDYFNRYTERILAVTASDVERVARKYIDTENLDFVIVGDRKLVGESVTALKLAPAKFLTVDDVLGPAPKEEK